MSHLVQVKHQSSDCPLTLLKLLATDCLFKVQLLAMPSRQILLGSEWDKPYTGSAAKVRMGH